MDLENLSLIDSAPKNSIVPVFKKISVNLDSIDFFAKLSDYGRKENCILLESADIVPKYGEQSMGSASPCLEIFGKENSFEIHALNDLGEKFLQSLKEDFGFAKISISKKSIKGKIPKQENAGISEEERLKNKTMADVLRTIAFKFRPAVFTDFPFAGLFGRISYDFIEQFEKLPKNRKNSLKENDFELFFLDNLFIYNHKLKELVLISNALVFEEPKNKREKIVEQCIAKIDSMEKALLEKIPSKIKFSQKKTIVSTDTSKKEYVDIVKKCKQNILEGDVFQIVPSRTIVSSFNCEPLDIYSELRKLNPSPYMFYFNCGKEILLGSSPETFIKVYGEKSKTLEIRPIAGTKPRGIADGKIDLDLDSRFEAELKVDRKELAEHAMLIDLARNDVARVCVHGSRFVENPFTIEKYSHVQHLVSTVKGTLKPELDALHAYLASMNMGTLTGAPKIKAMELLRKYENDKRGFYGGSIGYLTPSGNFDSAIVIRSALLKNKKAFVRAGAGIVFDSIPEKEFDETEKKAKAVLVAIEKANEKAVEK